MVGGVSKAAGASAAAVEGFLSELPSFIGRLGGMRPSRSAAALAGGAAAVAGGTPGGSSHKRSNLAASGDSEELSRLFQAVQRRRQVGGEIGGEARLITCRTSLTTSLKALGCADPPFAPSPSTHTRAHTRTDTQAPHALTQLAKGK